MLLLQIVRLSVVIGPLIILPLHVVRVVMLLLQAARLLVHVEASIMVLLQVVCLIMLLLPLVRLLVLLLSKPVPSPHDSSAGLSEGDCAVSLKLVVGV